MKSNWEITKKRSQYHFNPDIMDPKFDRVISLGRIKPNWSSELQQVMQHTYSASWRTSRPDQSGPYLDIEARSEEYDLESIGMDKNHIITDLNFNLPPLFQKIVDEFGLIMSVARVHVQRPGQLWNLHLDKLEKWADGDLTQAARYSIQLTDWQMGHFWHYGNYQYAHWHAGDVTTFDWINVPHSTANAGNTPRATLQITGRKTEKTHRFLDKLKNTDQLDINE